MREISGTSITRGTSEIRIKMEILEIGTLRETLEIKITTEILETKARKEILGARIKKDIRETKTMGVILETRTTKEVLETPTLTHPRLHLDLIWLRSETWAPLSRTTRPTSPNTRVWERAALSMVKVPEIFLQLQTIIISTEKRTT